MPPSENFHIVRARQELDSGYSASGSAAAQAHMKLAALHLARAAERLELVKAVSTTAG